MKVVVTTHSIWSCLPFSLFHIFSISFLNKSYNALVDWSCVLCVSHSCTTSSLRYNLSTLSLSIVMFFSITFVSVCICFCILPCKSTSCVVLAESFCICRICTCCTVNDHCKVAATVSKWCPCCCIWFCVPSKRFSKLSKRVLLFRVTYLLYNVFLILCVPLQNVLSILGLPPHNVSLLLQSFVVLLWHFFFVLCLLTQKGFFLL